MQAQYFTGSQGVRTETAEDPEGGLRNVAWIGHGDWTAYDPVHLHGVEEITFRVASEGYGGAIEARADAPDGELLGEVDVPVTGGWQEWTDVTMEVTDPGETIALYLVFTGDDPTVTDGLFNLNYFDVNPDRDGGHGDGPETELTSPEDGATYEVGEDVPLAAEVTDHGGAFSQPHLPGVLPRLLVTIPDAGRALAVGRSTVYELISARELETVHIGRACRVTIESLEAYVERLRGGKMVP